MKYLIILRGPPGVGKTTVSRHIINRLGPKKAVILYLDEVRTEKFELNVQQALSKEYVVGELFFGNSHTIRPEQWLSKFNDYYKISFILQIPFDTCYQRARTRQEYANYTEERYRVLYYGFKFLCQFNVFNQYAGVKEFCINAQSDSSSVADIIVEMI
jgi:thymidylate kinase